MPTPLTSTGLFATDKASRYLQQLCKHFGHKADVRFDATSGEAALPPGQCIMAADDAKLAITVTAPDDEGLTRAKFIVDKHLERFAFREGFTAMDWTDA